jgi:hypothetical protein
MIDVWRMMNSKHRTLAAFWLVNLVLLGAVLAFALR